jgi:O-antigen/teichoic acid export membrane protein
VRDGYQRLAGNTLATFAGRACGVVLAFVLSTVLFRALGERAFGLWSLFAYLVGYSALVDFGLSAAVERETARLAANGRMHEIRATVGRALTLLFAVTAALSAGVFLSAVAAGPVFGHPIPCDVMRGLTVLPVAMLLMTASLVVGGGLSGLQRMVPLHCWKTGGMAIGTAAVCVVAVAGVRRLDVLLLAYASGGPIAAYGQWRSLRTRLPPRGERSGALGALWRWNRESTFRLIEFGGVLQLATMGPMLGDYAFRLIVGHRFGVEYAGIYDLAARAALGLRSVVSALFVAMVPFGVSLLEAGDRPQVTRLLRVTVKYAGLFILPSSAVLFTAADAVVGVWLGPGEGATMVAATLRPLIVIHAIVSLTVPMAMIGRAAGRPAPEAITMWGAVLAGVAAALAAPAFSTAVVGFAIPSLIAGVSLWAWLSARLRVRFAGVRDLVMLAAVAGCAALATHGAQHVAAAWGTTPAVQGVVGIAVGGTVAVLATHGLRLVGPREREFLVRCAAAARQRRDLRSA